MLLRHTKKCLELAPTPEGFTSIGQGDHWPQAEQFYLLN